MENNKIEIREDILFFAFRYALGRMSTAPSVVATEIRNSLKVLSDSILYSIVREIDECKNYGMEIDKMTWMMLRDDVREELETRLFL